MKKMHRLTLKQINENPSLMSDEVFVPIEEVDVMLRALRAQHEAIDRLFARLIEAQRQDDPPFFPSESGQPWEALLFGKKVLDAAGVKL